MEGQHKDRFVIGRKNIVAMLFVCCCISAFAQGKPRLAILPFVGSSGGDGEAIATLFSFQRNIQEVFTVVPRTGAVDALIAEQNFQMTGYTDSDTIARLGRMLNADFVVSGHIYRLGDRNLVITTIINVETFEMIAGDYHEYRNIEEVRDLLPAMSQKIIAAAQRDGMDLPKLAILPFQIRNKGIEKDDAEVLAQILSVEITNTGRFAVLPRTATMYAALQELEYQMSGYTAEEEAKVLGRAANAAYVLSAEVHSLGSINMFTAQILHVEDGRLLDGESRDYRTATDGILLMPELARFLTDRAGAEALEREERIREEAREREKLARAKFWSIGISVGTSLDDPWVTGTVRGTFAPFPYSYFELGFDAGFISRREGLSEYYSLYPFVLYALFLPFAKNGGWYAGAGAGYMLQEYRIDDWAGSGKYLAVNVTTGFNIGNKLDIFYTLRTNFIWASSKLAVGYTYRFK